MKPSLIAALAAALLAGGCRSVFRNYQVDGLAAPVYYYAARPLEAGGDEETAVVIVHGYGDGVALPAEAQAFYDAADRWFGHAGQTPYVVAPMFPTAKTLAKFDCADTVRARWNDSMNEANGYRCQPEDDWRGGGDADNAPGLSSFDVVDRIFEQLGRNFPKLKRVVLTGFSAGGQYTSRYVAVGKGQVRDGVTVDYAPLSPSSWLRPGDDSTWHYGLARRPRYSAGLTREAIFANLAARRQWNGCGELDVRGRPYTSLDMTPEAMSQGTNRFLRFQSQHAYVRRYPDWLRQSSFHTFRGIAHKCCLAYATRAFVHFALGADSHFGDGYGGIELPADITLDERLALSAKRLGGGKYAPARCYLTEAQSWGWPGDTEGRLLLALVLQWKATGVKPATLDAILRRLPTELNARGYRGNIDTDFIREQQLFGNSWLLRALCEYAAFAKDPVIDAKGIAVRLAENLYLPCAARFRDYPISPAERSLGKGSGIGSSDTVVNGWQLSTDIGAALAGMDGVCAVWELTGDARFKAVLDAAADRFAEIDFVAIQAQTHSTLTTCRWLLRYDAARFLPLVERVFGTYRAFGMTDRAENYNWFGRTDTWTEPCAIVDSLIVCDALAKRTGKPEYRDLAPQIFRALCAHQRDNGGFGLKKTFPKGSAEPPQDQTYEAHWCCTMRGGAGLAWAKMNGY